ncbi:MAG TPA: helix-turn-helix domain-containing protein [Pseudonocardia sp.]|jgi:transcriptional regulator of acetoin/glycerol metabolism|nr:helix-turn-helix domain-containing protein [Pseudonocardia sp.]
MQASERKIARERERFLSSGGGDPSVRPEIASSWRRCLQWRVPVSGLEPPYRPEVDPDSALLRAASPVLDSLIERLGDLTISFLVSDASGRILDRRVAGDLGLRRLLDTHSVHPGFIFGEDAAGTNGVGTAIELGRTTRIDGYEHYASDLVAFTCVGVPITDPIRQRCVGVLDVTCAADRDNRLVSLIAEQTAAVIENRLLERNSQRERALLASFLRASKPGHGAVVVVSERVVMTNPRAARMLEGLNQAWLWNAAARSGDDPVWGELTLADGRVARTRTSPLRDGGELLGAMIELSQPSDERVEPRPCAASVVLDGATRGSTQPDALVGRDPAVVEAVRRAGLVSPGSVLVLYGEAGCGKSRLARAVGHTHCRTEPYEMDAAASVHDGEGEWLAEVTTALRGASSSMVVHHVELLSPPALRILAAALGTAGRRGWWCATTAIGAAPPVLPGVEQESVWMPPLRARRGDLAALVASFAAPRAVASEVVQLLARLPWQGNVRELRTAVDGLVAGAPDGARVGLKHLPVELRRAAARATLSRFERAELDAILEALAETDGNKKDAAALLGISRTTLYRKLKAGGIDLENAMY